MKTTLTFCWALAVSLIFFASCKKASSSPGATITMGAIGSTAPTQLHFWTQASVLSSCGGGIQVYLDGSLLGTISKASSTTPVCGDPSVLIANLTIGSHKWYAKAVNNTYVWGSATSQFSYNTTTSTPNCTKMELY